MQDNSKNDSKLVDNKYTLIIPIEMGKDVIESLTFHKPTLGELTKVTAKEEFARALEMLVACTDQNKISLQRLSWDDTQAVMGILADFLGVQGAAESEDS